MSIQSIVGERTSSHEVLPFVDGRVLVDGVQFSSVEGTVGTPELVSDRVYLAQPGLVEAYLDEGVVRAAAEDVVSGAKVSELPSGLSVAGSPSSVRRLVKRGGLGDRVGRRALAAAAGVALVVGGAAVALGGSPALADDLTPSEYSCQWQRIDAFSPNMACDDPLAGRPITSYLTVTGASPQMGCLLNQWNASGAFLTPASGLSEVPLLARLDALQKIQRNRSTPPGTRVGLNLQTGTYFLANPEQELQLIYAQDGVTLDASNRPGAAEGYGGEGTIPGLAGNLGACHDGYTAVDELMLNRVFPLATKLKSCDNLALSQPPNVCYDIDWHNVRGVAENTYDWEAVIHRGGQDLTVLGTYEITQFDGNGRPVLAENCITQLPPNMPVDLGIYIVEPKPHGDLWNFAGGTRTQVLLHDDLPTLPYCLIDDLDFRLGDTLLNLD